MELSALNTIKDWHLKMNKILTIKRPAVSAERKSEDDKFFAKNPMQQLDILLSKYLVYHTNHQIDNFIIAKSGGTAFGMWKQSMRELNSRQCALEAAYTERHELLIRIDELEWCANEGKTPKGKGATQFDIRRYRVQKERALMDMKHLDSTIKDREREFKRFFIHAFSWKRATEEQIYALRKNGDRDEITSKEMDMLEQEFWEHQIKCMAAIDYEQGKPPGENVISLLHNSPLEMRTRLGKEIYSNPKNLIKWYREYEVKSCPLMDAPVDLESLKLGA